MQTYELLTGERLDLSGLEKHEAEFLDRLKADAAKDGADYFDLLKRVKGPQAVPLRGRPITPRAARSPLYRAAHDRVDRLGIEQGYVLRPNVDRTAVKAEAGLLSVNDREDPDEFDREERSGEKGRPAAWQPDALCHSGRSAFFAFGGGRGGRVRVGLRALSPGLAVDVENVAMLSEAVDERHDARGSGEYGSPFLEGRR